MNNRTYVILTAAQSENIVFNDVMETSASTLRWNNNRTHTFVKFSGSTPSWLSGRTTYNQDQIRVILNDTDAGWWSEPGD